MTLVWVLVALAAYAIYILAREVSGGRPAGMHNAAGLLDLERDLGIHVEADVHGALDQPVPAAILGALYVVAQFVVVPGTLLFLSYRAPHVFRRLRATLLVSWVIGAVVAAFLPVAPPRMADPGVVTTLGDRASPLLDSSLATAIYNPLAAVPSMHVAFAVAVGVSWAALSTTWPSRALALTWPVVVSFVVIATGNHYVLDVVAGVVAIALGHVLARTPAWTMALGRVAVRQAELAGHRVPRIPRRRSAPRRAS